MTDQESEQPRPSPAAAQTAAATVSSESDTAVQAVAAGGPATPPAEPSRVAETSTSQVAETPPSEADIASGAANPYGLPEIAVQRPEVAAGAAFAGGLVLAQILKRLAR